MTLPKSFPLLSVAAVGMMHIGGSASGALFIYEGFDNTYSGGTINGVSSYNGGTGFDGAWQGTTTGTSFSVTNGSNTHGGSDPAGLTFTGLSTNDAFVLTRKSAPGGAQVNRTIDSTVAGNMTASTLYFSVLVRPKYYSVGNENLALTFGTSDVFDPNAKPVTSAGEALGFALKGGTPTSNQIDFQALAVDDGSTSVSTVGGIANPANDNTIHMIYGKIEWGSTDTITLYSSTTDTDLSSFSQFATLDAAVDESQFDTLHIAGQQVSSIDEIRFGSTLAEVGVVPEPGIAILGSFGLLGLLRRRR